MADETPMDPNPYNPNHPEFQISQYVDGHLNEPDRRALEAELSLDPTLQACQRDFEAINRELNDITSCSVDWKRFERRLAQRLDAESVRRPWRRLVWWTAGGTIAAAVAIFAFTLMMGDGLQNTHTTRAVVSRIVVGPKVIRVANREHTVQKQFRFARGLKSDIVKEGSSVEPVKGSVVVAFVSPVHGGSLGLEGAILSY